MQLPPKNDPHGDAAGALPRPMVLEFLYKNKVNVNHQADGTIHLEKAEEILAVDLTDPVGGVTIRMICREFGLDQWHFITA